MKKREPATRSNHQHGIGQVWDTSPNRQKRMFDLQTREYSSDFQFVPIWSNLKVPLTSRHFEPHQSIL